MKPNKRKFSCADCGSLNCWKKEGKYPDFCLTTNIKPELIDQSRQMYISDPFVLKVNSKAVDVDRSNYYQLTRAEEMIYFAKALEAKKVGVATCIGLIQEARVFCRMLEANDIDCCCVSCKVGAIDKAEVGLEQYKLKEDTYDPICNPALQAEVLNREKTDLNIIIGLCVGHDTIFIQYSEAPVTYLVVKDRVLVHNSAAALQKDGYYYKKICHIED